MINFKSFLTEQEEPKGKPLKHLTHVEDNVLHGGHEGVGTAAQHLEDVHNKLLGRNNSTSVTTKYDGAPSIVFGQHPQTGQFFVASKSAFNKNPKLNYTPEDIEKNHGHAPGLVEKLKAALQHLPKIMPRNGGVYQGDMMYTKPDIEKNKGMYGFTPNTITYSVPQDSAHGKAIKNSEMGVVVHTQYGGGKDLGSMSAMPLSSKQRDKFEKHPDVHNIDPTIEINPSNYSSEEQKAYLGHMENAKRSYAKMKPEAMDALQGHGETLERHVNDTVRQGGAPSVQGYLDHLSAANQKEVDKVKTAAAKERKIQAHAATAKNIIDNQDHFKKALEVHGHLQAAKNVLTGVMAKNSPFMHSINGEPTGPEGAVAVDKNGNASKFIDRAEFSRQNLLAGKYRAQQQSIQEDYGSSHVTTFMRANPPTAGHEAVVNKVLDVAKVTGGSHSVVLSHSQDASKNPLSPTQKLKHAKRAFPNANVEVASDDAPTLLHQAVKAHNNGVQNLHVVVGQDRVGQFQKLLSDYNGKQSKHGYYNFKNINVHSAGDRDPDAEGLTGISGTKMRAAASSGDRTTFHSGASSAMNEKHRDDMMKDVQKAMTVKEGYEDDEEERRQASMNAPETPVSSFLKKNTPIGTVDELGSALHKGDVKGAILPAAKLGTLAIPSPKLGMLAGGAVGAAEAIRNKMKLKENTTASVGGLGFNSGNPAPDGDAMQQYQDTNGSLARDDENGNLIKMHNAMHAPLGFKEFDPKKDLAKGNK